MDGSYWMVMGLFLVAGLLVGGVISSYQNGSKAATLVMMVLAGVAVVGAVLVLLGVVG